MIEVFKTNVENHDQADNLIEEIHKNFSNYAANFDLDDCDNILRIKCAGELIEPGRLIHFLNKFGYHAEVLEDEIKPAREAKIYENNK